MDITSKVRARFSIGYNFDPALIEGLAAVNLVQGGERMIDEVFAALPDSPVSSARPTSRIPRISWSAFRGQVSALRSAGISFNFLMNTSQRITGAQAVELKTYLAELEGALVERITVGTPELGVLVKEWFPHFHVTMSITYGCKSHEQLAEIRHAGANAVYLDGVYVNRDFSLLRTLVKDSRLECRLYANMSCISRCPVAPAHYGLFSRQSDDTGRLNDAFFAGCTMVKLRNPVEWLQMPWIRPEDIDVYVEEGVSHFKLADRLASTPTLLRIATAYLRAKSPDSLFFLMERDGSKYRPVLPMGASSHETPLHVKNHRIPPDFIQHFRTGHCTSSDPSCTFCKCVAGRAIRLARQARFAAFPAESEKLVPIQLKSRVLSAT